MQFIPNSPIPPRGMISRTLAIKSDSIACDADHTDDITPSGGVLIQGVFLCGSLRTSACSAFTAVLTQRSQRYAENRREKTESKTLLSVLRVSLRRTEIVS